jgi:fimbrial isopeptide formation D2 family protein
MVIAAMVVLAGLLVVVPVERAQAADVLELGPDGYFSGLSAGATPVASSGWASTRRIVFGKQKDTTYPDTEVHQLSVSTLANSVSGGYKTLAKGAVESVPDADFGYVNIYGKSATTSVGENEALLWAEDVVTIPTRFGLDIEKNTFDTTSNFNNPAFQSVTARALDTRDSLADIAGKNYSSFEQSLFGVGLFENPEDRGKVEGVCTKDFASGCKDGFTAQSLSRYKYQVFSLSGGDMGKYFNHTTGLTGNDTNLACPKNTCANGSVSSWLRSPFWMYVGQVLKINNLGNINGLGVDSQAALRPAFRLQLDDLLLSANAVNQSQVLNATDSLRLTFVDRDADLIANASAKLSGSTLTLSGDLDTEFDGYGWKFVDVNNASKVFASGFSMSGKDIEVPSQIESGSYQFWYWGQDNGDAAEGWTNRATLPGMLNVEDGDLKDPEDPEDPENPGNPGTPPSYGIELSGVTSGGLKAYQIGSYEDVAFDHSGALRSVRLNTPAALKTVVNGAVSIVGGRGVDVDNPVGWVGVNWLGYPTDPLSDDVSSAYSPYAGKLQLFAQELTGKSDVELGGVKGSLPAGTFASLTTKTLAVSDPGLYLIVDDSGTSLPMIVGTKVFNEALGDEGRLVDFVDAGVKGKPRLGVASLKSTITDIAKHVVNDAGLDGFDVGASVEFEVVLRVPDVSSFTSVSYDSYEFVVSDVAESGLTLPADGSGVEVFVDAASLMDKDVSGSLPASSITASGQTLSVDGLKVLFTEDAGGHVANKTEVPAGSLIRIRYRAVLNTNALLSAPGGGGVAANANTATLTCSKSDGGTELKTASAAVYSFRVDVVKVDKDDTSKTLSGAKFEVSREKTDGSGRELLAFKALPNGVYRLAVSGETGTTSELVSSASGVLSVVGVEARELSFKETVAPSGYFTVRDFAVEVIPVWDVAAGGVTLASYRTGGMDLAYVSQDGRMVVVADPSRSLLNLPFTGGRGVALLLLMASAFLLVAVRPYYLSHRAEATANILI